MGAASSSSQCASTIFSQITSVGQVALTIVSWGTSTAATGTAQAAKGAGTFGKLLQEFNQLKQSLEES